MIVGHVTSTPEAVVPLEVRGPDGRRAQVNAIVDTGFTDYLTLPTTTISDLRLVPIDTLECQLADGRTVALQSFQATVMWDGEPREVLALAADGEPLLGMSLLYGSRLVINVMAGRDLTIERME